MATSLGCGSEAPLTLPCVGGGTERSKGSLEQTHPRKNSVSGSWVVASAEAALCGEACVAASRSKVELGGAGLATRRESTGEAATLQELSKRKLRGGIGECGWHRVICIAEGLCFTEVSLNTWWNCVPEGVFGKTAQTPRWRVAWRRLLW